MEILFLLIGIILIFGLVVLLPMLISFFYKHDFKAVTGIEFPEDAKILYKTADFPDHSGDYTSVSIVRVNSRFFEDLPSSLQKKGLTENQDKIGTEEFDKALLQLGNNKIHREFSIQ